MWQPGPQRDPVVPWSERVGVFVRHVLRVLAGAPPATLLPVPLQPSLPQRLSPDRDTAGSGWGNLRPWIVYTSIKSGVKNLMSLQIFLQAVCSISYKDFCDTNCQSTSYMNIFIFPAPARRNKLTDLQKQLTLLSNIELSTVTSSGLPLREVLKNEIDDIVASECLYCGEYMITCIDRPFIADEDWDRVMKEWEWMNKLSSIYLYLLNTLSFTDLLPVPLLHINKMLFKLIHPQ